MGEPSSQASQATTLRMGGGDDDDEMDGYADEARGFAGGRTSPEMASGSADTTDDFPECPWSFLARDFRVRMFPTLKPDEFPSEEHRANWPLWAEKHEKKCEMALRAAQAMTQQERDAFEELGYDELMELSVFGQKLYWAKYFIIEMYDGYCQGGRQLPSSAYDDRSGSACDDRSTSSLDLVGSSADGSERPEWKKNYEPADGLATVIAVVLVH